MAASTILLRRSTACLIGSGSQFYCRYLSAAAKRSHFIIPTSVSSVRRYSSSSPLNSDEPTARDYAQKPANNQPTISKILAEIESVRKEIESIRKEREEGKKEPPIEEVVVVKEKHPLLKNIESEMSKSEELNCETDQKLELILHGLEVVSNKPGAASVILKGKHENEIINIELSIPAYYVMLLTIKGSGRFKACFNSTEAVFHCTFTSNGFEVEKIKEPNGTIYPGILFYNLPKNLKDEFHKYLETRGVHKDNVSNLYSYMVGRTNRENLRGVENFRKMVEAALCV